MRRRPAGGCLSVFGALALLVLIVAMVVTYWPVALLAGAVLALLLWRRYRVRREVLVYSCARAFEEECAALLRTQGMTHVTVVGGQGDGGVDVVGVDALGGRVILQAKNYAPHRPVGVDTILRMLGSRETQGATRAIVATTSRFTMPAEELACTHGIETWDGDTLRGYVQWAKRSA
jgi:restriction system protein